MLLISLATLAIVLQASAAVTDWPSIESAVLRKPVAKFWSGTEPAFAAAAADPVTPESYQLMFGPMNAATQANGYMGFEFLATYDTAACASACNARAADALGGLCQFFNIYQTTTRATNLTSFVCSMYYLSTDNSTAINPGDINVSISNSRGYKRVPILSGTFEGFTCANRCNTTSFGGWIGTATNNVSASDVAVILHASFGHSPFAGNAFLPGGSIGLGSFPGSLPADPNYNKRVDSNGTMTFSNVQTVKNRTYSLGTFVNIQGAILKTLWNGQVIDTITSNADFGWTFHGYTLTAAGNDTFAFRGENSTGGQVYVDDVYVFLLN